MILRFLPSLSSAGGWGLAFLAGALVGWHVTHQQHVAKEQAYQLESAIQRAKQGQRDYERLVKISNELDNAQRTSTSLRDELSRLRIAYARSHSAGSANSLDSTAVANCRRLLQESAEILTEGGELLQRNAALHDALSKAVKR